MRLFKDLTGKLFGSLNVIAYAGVDRHGRRRWRVMCARCGEQKVVLAANLLSGRSKSCGCAAWEKARQRLKGFVRMAKVIGPNATAGYEWDGADDHLDRIQAEIAAEEASKATTG